MSIRNLSFALNTEYRERGEAHIWQLDLHGYASEPADREYHFSVLFTEDEEPRLVVCDLAGMEYKVISNDDLDSQYRECVEDQESHGETPPSFDEFSEDFMTFEQFRLIGISIDLREAMKEAARRWDWSTAPPRACPRGRRVRRRPRRSSSS